MRVKLWNRFVIALTGLLLLAAGILLALCAAGFTPNWLDMSWLEGKLTATWQRAVLGGAGALLVILGLHNVCMLFKGKKMKGFIMQRTDYGDMSISMKALETMVHKCVDQHSELEVKSTKIYRVKNGILVQIRILLETGVNIPLTVSALQKQIKQYIVSCSGVDVREVRVLVETNSAKAHAKDQSIVVDNRKPTIVPEPIVIEKEEVAEEIPAPVVEVQEEIAPAEETVTETVEEIVPEEPAEDLFEGFDAFVEEVSAEESAPESDKEEE